MPRYDLFRTASSSEATETETASKSRGRERLSERRIEADHFSKDVQELIRLFQEFGVRFLVIGGEAVIFHGYPRYTGDVDFHYDPEPKNAQRLFLALSEFWGGDVPGIAEFEELTVDGLVLQFGRPPNRVDLLSRVSGVQFGIAWERRVKATMNDRELPYLGLEDLVAAKEAAGRPKDLQDLVYLTKLLDESRD